MANDVESSTFGEVERLIKSTDLPPAVKAMFNVMLNEATMDDSTDSGLMDILEAILAGDGEDAVYAAANSGATSGKTYVDKPFFLTHEDVHWKISNVALSQAAQGRVFPFYAFMQVTDMETGEIKALTCGGSTFCTVLFKLMSMDLLKPENTDFEAGYPLVIKAKPAGLGEVLIPNKFTVPKMAAQRTTKTAGAAAAK